MELLLNLLHSFLFPSISSLNCLFYSFYRFSTMKLIKNLPKKLFKSKKSRSLSRSDDSSSSSNKDGLSTPTSVLPNEWSAADLVQAFSVIDNGYGKINKEQLKTILSRVGGKSPPNEEELDMLVDELDKNGDGCISLQDFETISSAAAFEFPAAAAAEDGGGELRDAFDFFDEDHDGKITGEELYNVFRVIGDERCTLDECRRMIASVDKNGDGFVCFDDFCLMMEQQR